MACVICARVLEELMINDVTTQLSNYMQVEQPLACRKNKIRRCHVVDQMVLLNLKN
jgi:hypothetical protein